MNASFRNGRDAIVVLVLLAIPFFFLRSNIRDPRTLNKLDQAILRVSAPMQYVGSWMGRGISSLIGSYVYLVDVKSENQRLKKDLVRLHDRARRLENLEADNRRLRRMLGLKEQLPLDAVTAQVIGKDMTEFRVANIKLDRVSDAIKQGWPVLNEEGVVGVILRGEPEQHYLQVQLAIDPQFAVDVMNERTGARGLARGTLYNNKYACRIEYMRRSDEVSIGDLLVTSGVGKRFAKGVPVARITSIHNRGFGEFQEVEAEPVVSFSRLEDVFIVPPSGIEPTINNERKGR